MRTANISPELAELLQRVKAQHMEIWLGKSETVIGYRGPRGLLKDDFLEKMNRLRIELKEFLLQQSSFTFPIAKIQAPNIDTNCIVQLQIGKHRCGLFGMPPITGFGW